MKGETDIGKIYDDYSVRLYNIGLRIVGDASDAEEIMHDTLLKYLSYGWKDEIRDLAGWLAQTCIRKAIDRLREKHRYKDFRTTTGWYLHFIFWKDMTIRRFLR